MSIFIAGDMSIFIVGGIESGRNRMSSGDGGWWGEFKEGLLLTSRNNDDKDLEHVQESPSVYPLVYNESNCSLLPTFLKEEIRKWLMK